jgi:CRP/FNR family transcriptional regulator, cyclic AMP receptor protein
MLQRRRDVRADGHLDVLGSIPPAYRKAVLEQCERRVVAKGETVWVQGEPAQYVVFLVSGKAMSWYQARNGKTGTTGFWCAGDLLGAADMGTGTTRQQTVRCLEECVIHTLSYERFDDLIRRFPELALAVIRALSIRLRWVAQLAVTLETQSASERICSVLLALSERFGMESDAGIVIDLKLTNEDLAAIAGVTRQFTNTTLHDLRNRGLLVTRNRNLILADRAALEKLAYHQ